MARDSLTHEPLGFASVFLANTTYGATTDAQGRFELRGVAPGPLPSENRLLGMGPLPTEAEADPGRQTVPTLPGSSLFSSANSFAIIRGEHVHLTLGALEVAETGDITKKIVTGLAVLDVTPGGLVVRERAKCR